MDHVVMRSFSALVLLYLLFCLSCCSTDTDAGILPFRPAFEMVAEARAWRASLTLFFLDIPFTA